MTTVDSRSRSADSTGAEADETWDVLWNRLWIRQARRGYRFSVDALLLAHFIRFHRNDRLLELGAGSGVVSLILARRWRLSLWTLELQENLVRRARESALVNGLDGLVRILQGDLREIGRFFPSRSFDAVFFNPPYRRAQAGRISVGRERALARHDISGGLAEFLAAACAVLRPAGRVFLIYPADRLVDLMGQCRACALEPKRIRLVHSRAQERAVFVLLEAVQGAGAELCVLPPLVMYEGCCYAEELRAIFSDLAAESAAGEATPGA